MIKKSFRYKKVNNKNKSRRKLYAGNGVDLKTDLENAIKKALNNIALNKINSAVTTVDSNKNVKLEKESIFKPLFNMFKTNHINKIDRLRKELDKIIQNQTRAVSEDVVRDQIESVVNTNDNASGRIDYDYTKIDDETKDLFKEINKLLLELKTNVETNNRPEQKRITLSINEIQKNLLLKIGKLESDLKNAVNDTKKNEIQDQINIIKDYLVKSNTMLVKLIGLLIFLISKAAIPIFVFIAIFIKK